MSVTLLEVMAAASQRVAPLTGECAGYLVLAAADQLALGPRVIAAGHVSVEQSGAVRILGGAAADAAECERSLRQLLDDLMLLSRNGSAALMRAGRRPSAGNLELLVKELEVALIPANRAAAARSLARLHRETMRALEAGSLARGGTDSVDPIPVPTPEALREAAASAAPEPSAQEIAPPPRVVEQPAAAEIEVEVEVEFELEPTPTPAALGAVMEAVAFSAVPDEPVLMSDSARLESETPTEPVLLRAARRAVPDASDIHRTPYLGTLVGPSSEPGLAPDWASALGMHHHGAAESDDALVGDGATTDPMPEAVEWLESEELEEVAPIDTLAWPEPHVADRKVPPAPRCFAPPESDVHDLIARFRVAEPEPTALLLRGLKELAGISATPPPVAAAVPPSGADEREAGGPAQREPEPSRPIEPLRTVTIGGS